jgi:hypothetical protein
MKFGAFQRSQGEVPQNVKPRSPRSTFDHHYMRNMHLRHARTKNGNAQIACFRHRVSHYRVIRDARPSVSLISIHWRCVKLEHVSDYKTHPRRALRVCITNLITGWGPYGTNKRRAWGHMFPINKTFETRFILACHRFNCQLGHCDTNRRRALLDARLLFDAPLTPPPMGVLVAGCILELARIWQPHCQDKQHTHIETYIKSNGDHTFNYIYQSNITQSVNRFDHKAYVSSIYHTKNNCHLAQSL